MGRGLRFNNPYRLATILGQRAESVSISAPFLDLEFGWARGAPHGISHGAILHLSMATSGVSQQVLSAGYLALARVSPRWLVLGRVSLPFVLCPSVTGGLESALGFGWLATAGLGVKAELSGSLFYGAATWDRSATAIPLVSLQISALFDLEVLP